MHPKESLKIDFPSGTCKSETAVNISFQVQANPRIDFPSGTCKSETCTRKKVITIKSTDMHPKESLRIDFHFPSLA